MSLIGPRPERPEFVRELEQALPGYRTRHAVLPGITGLAQVQLPPDTDLESVRRKLAYDLYYVQHLSLWLDLRILVATGCTCSACRSRCCSACASCRGRGRSIPAERRESVAPRANAGSRAVRRAHVRPRTAKRLRRVGQAASGFSSETSHAISSCSSSPTRCCSSGRAN